MAGHRARRSGQPEHCTLLEAEASADAVSLHSCTVLQAARQTEQRREAAGEGEGAASTEPFAATEGVDPACAQRPTIVAIARCADRGEEGTVKRNEKVLPKTQNQHSRLFF